MDSYHNAAQDQLLPKTTTENDGGEIHDASFTTASTPPTTFDLGSDSLVNSQGEGDLDGPASVDTPACSTSWSMSSDRQLGYGSQQDASDRVFPIRSVVTVEPAARTSGDSHRGATAMPEMPSTMNSGIPRNASFKSDLGTSPRQMTSPTSDAMPSIASRMASPSSRPRPQHANTFAGSLFGGLAGDAGRYGNVQSVAFNPDEPSDDDFEDTGSYSGESSIGQTTEPPIEPLPGHLYSRRFNHVVTSEGHAVITGHGGILQRCEDEPIHAPGAVQGFGLMIALHEESDGCFLVRYVSENSKKLIGYSPQELFRTTNFLDLLTDEQAENLLDHIDFIRDEDADPAVNGPEVFSTSIRSPKRKSIKLWCAMHIPPTQPDLIVCEFELDNDRIYPLRPADELTPDVPEDTLHGNPTMEELTESTEIMSKPLRILRTARKRTGEAGAIQVFDIMSQVQEQLASAPNLENFLKILVGIVKELTGFHRVMVYQFDASFNGRVVTELVDPAQTRDLYKGLNFPASDIPSQARNLYKLNKVRLLYDRELQTARIVCRSVEDLETPLDMTHSYLRAMSPIHLKYLGNMAVRSSMSISINAFNELWGLIACHSYGPKGMRVSFPIRKMCRLVGDNVSRNIERLSYASRLQARKLINTVPTHKNPSGYIVASSDDLLALFDADFGMLSIHEETKILGKLEQSHEILAMLEYLRLRRLTTVVTSQDIGMDFPELRYQPGFAMIAGLLYVPLSVGGSDFIVFFRKGQTREVKWAGNPYEKNIQEGTAAYLEPRTSFRAWRETIVGNCREWSEEQVETAAVLCLVYGKFIEVWRQKEAVLENSRLRRLLLANSAHEVRTPLNAIIGYLEIALEGPLDSETRENLSQSHSASKSLIYVINDLLDLTKTEEGQGLIKDEVFDFSACIREATDPFRIDARRKGIAYKVVNHPGLPHHIVGDQRRVRQAVANMTANAVKNTTTGSVTIESYVSEVQDGRVRVEIAIEDTGNGMDDAELDRLFRELEQVSTDLDDRVIEEKEEAKKPKSPKMLGLGLAVVARIVRIMDGQLRLKSEPGKGSRFVVQLPFRLPPEDSEPDSKTTSESTNSTVPSVSTFEHQSQEGERLLVNSRSSAQSHISGMISAKRSFDDTTSIHSQNSALSGSSVRSDADRLIDAIQSPLAFRDSEAEVGARQRRNSRGKQVAVAASTSLRSTIAQSGSRYNSDSQPGVLTRATSLPDHGQLAERNEALEPVGMAFVTDSRTPIRAVKIPDEYVDQPEHPPPFQSSRVLFEITSDKDNEQKQRPALTVPPVAAGDALSVPTRLKVLIAEDDPINLTLLRKRLEKAGHEVYHAVNGEDCASVHGERSNAFDVILMDMQMPIVDGLTSTKMIRALEHSEKHCGLSTIAEKNGRIPIFAVSASLVEQEKETYVRAGFDGWILKPIDFKRLEVLLQGISDDEIRNKAVYTPGHWEHGGWFRRRNDLPQAEKAKQLS